MGCGASAAAPTADAGGGTSLTRQLTAAIDRTSKSTRVSTLQREAIEEADALLPEYMRLGVAVEWLREFVREHKIEKETTREVSLKMSAALAEADRENILRLIRQDLGASKLNAVIAKAMTGALTDAGKRESMVGASSKPRGGDLK